MDMLIMAGAIVIVLLIGYWSGYLRGMQKAYWNIRREQIHNAANPRRNDDGE